MNAAPERQVIGVDFDNTIAGYDELMFAIATERGLIAESMARNKRLIRDAIRALPDGESHWRGLQATVYGPRMREARLIDGVREFFTACRIRRIPVHIVSHKTEYANFGEASVNLRAAATEWLDRQGFFDGELGISTDDVFFEATRAEKIERIKALGATHFVDDLEETFLEPAFPRDVAKILLTAQPRPGDIGGATGFSTWGKIHEYLLGSAVAVE